MIRKIEAYQPKKSSQKVKVENKISPIIKDLYKKEECIYDL